MSVQKRKHVSLNLDKKLEILNLLQSKRKTRKELAMDYGCDLSTIVRIVQQEEKIRNIALENGNTARKRMRKGKYDKVDEAVTVWFREMRAKNAIINGPIIMEEARKFAQKLEFHDFEPSNGWLSRWKTKENVSFHDLQGEKGAADQAGAAEWINNVLEVCLHKNADDVEEEEEKEEQEQVLSPLPSRKDALAALTVLRAYFENKKADLKNVDALEEQFCVLSAATTFQKKISD